MSAEVAEAIRQTRRTLSEKTWVPRWPRNEDECCVLFATPDDDTLYDPCVAAMSAIADTDVLSIWNDRQTDVGAVLGMTLQALIAELCKRTA